MNKNQVPITNIPKDLQQRIDSLKAILNTLELKVNTFENTLRNHLEDAIIEEQELSVLYKQLKKDKKEKRILQKTKGNKFKEGVISTASETKNQNNKNFPEEKEKKRLYREAMLKVHPDKFSTEIDKLEIATETTTKLIEIYSSGDLKTLKAFHQHILNGTIFNSVPTIKRNIDNEYLLLEIDKLEQQILALKNKHTYKVLEEYANPMTFLDELKAYYEDRLFKLRKRTRKG